MVMTIATGGCATVSGFNDLEKVEAERDSGTAIEGDTAATVDSLGTDSSQSDTSEVADTATPDTSFACPMGTKGPTMINVGGYCVDATEVTTAQYSVFLVAKGSDTSGQSAACAWNTSYTPLYWPQTGLETHPVMGVDWCDAYAYCAWAGKRLCGKIGGGAAAFASPSSATESQWYAACTQSGARTYPYGASFVAAACQDGTIKPPRTAPAGTKLACDGGYAGVLDMSGNIQEWEDSCDGATGSADNCRVRGGMIYDDTPSALACASGRALARNTRNDHTGFRCCSP